jgi:glycosyltransferase involved in cell wall biosynthesis
MTGGLQEQVTDGENVFGVAIEPASKALVGSIMVPYIREDRVSQEDFEAALLRMVEMPKQQREILGKLGQQHVDKNYNFETFQKRWVQIMLDAHEKYGSWETRKGYDRFELKEIQ